MKLYFATSKEMDLEVALAFRAIKAGGVNFREWGILQPHPELRARRLTSPILIAYTEQFYREHKSNLEEARYHFLRTWKNVSRTHYLLLQELFGFPFQMRGTYRCYVSMWNCNPRDISHKTFQIFYRNSHPVEMITHEMLHFAFYDYIYERHPYLRHERYSKKLWKLSEAFNTVVLNFPKWRKKLRMRRQAPYPVLQGLVQQLRREWIQNRSLDTTLDKFLK